MSILILVSCLGVSYIALSIIYNLFFHPLAKYPGPFLARVSSWPSFYHACKGDRHVWTWQQFQIYGEKFRAAPNLILFNTPAAYNSLFNPRANVKKSKFYDAWSRNEHDYNTLSTTDIKEHRERRRRLALAFTEQSAKASGVFMAKHIDRWHELLPGDRFDEQGWSEPKNMSVSTEFLIFDMLGDLCFGKNFDTKEPGENMLKEIPHFITEYTRFFYPMCRSPFLDAILWLKPRGLNRLMAAISPKQIDNYYAFVEEAVVQRVSAERKREEEKRPAEREDMFYFLCTARDPETGELALNKQQLVAEANLLIVAGTDSGAGTISALFFYMMHNARVYAKLVQEIRDTFDSPEDIVYGSTLANCQYLRACIDETLRLAPNVPSEVSREVLPGGTTIDGEFFPGGTTVGVPHWSLGRNEDHYGDANTFRPERWIVSNRLDTLNTEQDVRELRKGLHTFGKGVGSCLGQNIAILQISMVVARTLWRMDVRIAPGSNLGGGRSDLGWGQRDRKQFMLKDAYIFLKDGPLLQFKRRSMS